MGNLYKLYSDILLQNH